MTQNMLEERLADFPMDHRKVIEGLDADTPVEDEVEASGAWVLRRFIPIVHGGQRKGVIGFVRDITESRLRDRALLIKDATIREIHHRVKNNLQTVASLLRLQARRLGTNEARAELEESVRRISSIALVHETLSQDSTERVEFDRVAQRVLEMVESSLVNPEKPVRFSLEGSAGDLNSDIATPLSLVLNELIQNTVEHAFIDHGGTVTVELKREDPRLLVVVRDDGVGFPQGFSIEKTSNLGLQIVRTLVGELKGEIRISTDAGARIELEIPLTKN
jgi:two-component sensor histidine kinase